MTLLLKNRYEIRSKRIKSSPFLFVILVAFQEFLLALILVAFQEFLLSGASSHVPGFCVVARV